MPLPLIKVAVDYNPRLTPAELKLLSLGNRLKNLRQLMIEDIAPAAEDMLLKHWESQGHAFGQPWAPLQPATIARKLRKGTLDRGILHDTEHLFKTVVASRLTDNRLQKTASGGLRLQMNTSVYYAVFHQVGTRYMAERQVIPNPLPQTFIRKCRQLIKDYLNSSRQATA